MFLIENKNIYKSNKVLIFKYVICFFRVKRKKSNNYIQKKDLIESKKLIFLNDFLWFIEMICLDEIKFVWFKQNIFKTNKYLFESNELFFKTMKLMHWYMVKDIICLI